VWCYAWRFQASSPACTELETVMLDWLGKMLKLPDDFIAGTLGHGGGVIQVRFFCVILCLPAERFSGSQTSQTNPSNIHTLLWFSTCVKSKADILYAHNWGLPENISNLCSIELSSFSLPDSHRLKIGKKLPFQYVIHRQTEIASVCVCVCVRSSGSYQLTVKFLWRGEAQAQRDRLGRNMKKRHSLMRQNCLPKKQQGPKGAGRESRFRAGRVKQAEPGTRTGRREKDTELPT